MWLPNPEMTFLYARKTASVTNSVVSATASIVAKSRTIRMLLKISPSETIVSEIETITWASLWLSLLDSEIEMIELLQRLTESICQSLCFGVFHRLWCHRRKKNQELQRPFQRLFQRLQSQPEACQWQSDAFNGFRMLFLGWKISSLDTRVNSPDYATLFCRFFR